MPDQLKRARNLVGSTFKSASPPAEAAPSGRMVTVGTASSIPPGELRRFEVEGEPVAVGNVGGSFHAVHDTCTHRKCSLSDGELNGTTLTCICHGSQFDISTGARLRGPAERPVRHFPAHLTGDDLQLEI